MTPSTGHKNVPTEPDHEDERLTTRLDKARRAADRQELTLRRSAIQCGSNENTRFDLLYQRYNQPVAYGLTLKEVEVWLDIRRGAQR